MLARSEKGSTRGMFIGDLFVYDFFTQAIISDPLYVCFNLGLVVLSMQAGNIHEIFDFNAPFFAVICSLLQRASYIAGLEKNEIKCTNEIKRTI